MSKQDKVRPNPEALLATLKDFQRRTVEYVHRRFFLDEDSTNRFLVADEVGLGKTLVARGVTALALDRLWDDTNRIDVVYVCSNAEIAGQNLKRLRVSEDHYTLPTRLTLLPLHLHDLAGRKLNFVSLTPGTSFDPHSSMGRGEERAVLYLMLRDAWGLGKAKPPLNLLCGGMRRDRFAGLVSWIQDSANVDGELKDAFLAALERNERESSRPLRPRFEELLGSFKRVRERHNLDWEVRAAQSELIAELRSLLARTCIQALEPDLIIVDEFQRFKHLLTSESEAGELARHLFDYVDPRTGQTAKTLLLSATPYKAYANSSDLDAASHHEDFLATIDFLLGDPVKRARLAELLAEFKNHILRWDDDTPRRIAATREAIETKLRKVMSRTERLAASPDRNGMLAEVPADAADVEVSDLAAYLVGDQVAEILGHHDVIEYWKSAPYLLNLMDHYKLKRSFVDALEDGPTKAQLRHVLKRGKGALLSWGEITRYERLDPGNARMRALAADLLDQDAWKLLWLRPSLPYYEPAGPFASEGARTLTKRLVFSSWAVVPKAISLVLSYEAERRMMRAYDPTILNTREQRERRGSLLRVTLDGDRPTGMTVLALTYPSFALAELVDPATLAADHAAVPDRDDALTIVSRKLAPLLDELVCRYATDEGREDERWYWAVPLLLDTQQDPDATSSFLQGQDVSAISARGGSEADDAAWPAHLELARKAAQGALDPPLGPPPADLAELIAMLALAGPGVTALRALTRGAGSETLTRADYARFAALRVAWAFRALFNTPEASELVRGLYRGEPFWRGALAYCMDGCLQSVLDEYAHVLRDHLGHSGGPLTRDVLDDIAGRHERDGKTYERGIADALHIRATPSKVDVIETERGPRIRSARMRARFAMRLADQEAEDGATLARASHVRTAFNSPFWPFVLASTSVGQEGLDFHLYCHAVVHWNLPGNPVDLEQREGRVHRYKGHAIRRNLARRHGADVLRSGATDVWAELFRRGEADRPPDQSELWPYWLYSWNDGDGEEARIERHVPALPLSRDRIRAIELQRSLMLYRSVLGQARQEDLVKVLAGRVPEDRHNEVATLLRIDLAPPATMR